MLSSKFTTKDIERFWSKIDCSGNHPEGCWEWQCSTKHGYGTFHIGGRRVNGGIDLIASRASWMLVNGDIPDGLDVLHTCDNRKCCNPAHLYLGTDADNARDKVNRKRHPRGENTYNAKLTWKQVREIREQYSTGMLQLEIAKEFGVRQQYISRIVRNEIWKE